MTNTNYTKMRGQLQERITDLIAAKKRTTNAKEIEIINKELSQIIPIFKNTL